MSFFLLGNSKGHIVLRDQRVSCRLVAIKFCSCGFGMYIWVSVKWEPRYRNLCCSLGRSLHTGSCLWEITGTEGWVSKSIIQWVCDLKNHSAVAVKAQMFAVGKSVWVFPPSEVSLGPQFGCRITTISLYYLICKLCTSKVASVHLVLNWNCVFLLFFPSTEMSHRSSDFAKIINNTENLVRELL